MKHSIKKRLVRNFMLIILMTVLVLEILVLTGVRRYYYMSVEDILKNQIEFSIGYSLKYLNLSSIEDMIINDVDLFWQNTQAQVQIFDSEGRLLMDSIGMIPSENKVELEALKAVGGEGITNIYSNENGESVMSVTVGIEENENKMGAVKFITSLEETNETIRYIGLLLLGIGLIVIITSGAVGIFLANTIVKPLNQVTDVANEMASGNLYVRSKIAIPDEIGQLANTLNYMADELIKREDIKNDFISSISHELRTPLTSIKGWAITLQDEDLDEEILYEGLDIIEKESERLNYMVEELLDFSSFVSHRIVLKRENISLNKLVKSVYRQLTPRAEDLEIEFILETDGENIILGDGNRIKQVLINIIDNSFKFTSENPKILIKTIEDKEKNIGLVTIEDNGIGISPEEILRVKEKFYKGKSSKSNSGIGLSIADEIMKLHDGNLIVESELQKYTKVTLEFPLLNEVIC